MSRLAKATPRQVIVITDPGPDPDDVKALLVLAMAHRHAHIHLAAVIANGGGRPARRAQLARLLLDRIGQASVPVGIGSLGVTLPEQPHECSVRGFDAVDPARLLDGKALLARTLARAPPKGVTMLLISGLRDFADMVATQPELVLRKVSAVAIQGGLVPDAASPFGFVPDTSQNNAFDPEAAEAVYAFCFEHGIRMSVVSRNAVPVRWRRALRNARSARLRKRATQPPVPRSCSRARPDGNRVAALAARRAQLLPMQLARSFAVRTESEVLRYLANAQFLGLAGLWQKLCAGQLPARCDKAWYFATFCGIDGAEFARRELAELDETADILTHLNGFVKPYDGEATAAEGRKGIQWARSARLGPAARCAHERACSMRACACSSGPSVCHPSQPRARRSNPRCPFDPISNHSARGHDRAARHVKVVLAQRRGRREWHVTPSAPRHRARDGRALGA